MTSSSQLRLGSWLKGPARSKIGSISLAGALKDVNGINPESMRTLGSYAFIFIRSGRGIYQDQNGLGQTFGPGDALLIFPDLAHAYGPDQTGNWEQVYIVFSGPQFDLLREAGILSPASPIWNLGSAAYWLRRIEELFPSSSLREEFDATRTIGRFTSLLTEMAAAHAEASLAPREAWLGESIHLLSEPSDHAWLTPQETAQRVGLSYENFRKLFSKHVGESPGAFQKRRRIEHACTMIYQDSRSFKELADEHGFCDVFHFSKVFTQVLGESPSDYRKRVNGK